MKFLYIGAHDVFSRHELGFIAALNALGTVDVIALGSKVECRRVSVGSDNGVHRVTVFHIPCRELINLNICIKWIERLVGENDYHAIFATPRLPVVVARSFADKNQLVILRLWSIRATKLRDNLRFGAYEDIAIFAPSIGMNLLYLAISNYFIAIDYATFSFVSRMYPILRNRLIKLYPPYGYIPKHCSWKEDVKLPDIVDREDYVLGFTTLSKTGSYLKFEAKPHALALYQIAKKTGLDVVLAGSSLEDWQRVFPNLRPPPNLHFIGRGFSDLVVAKLYSNARLVVVPITNRNISNRLLEALFYGKPIVTSEIVRYIHPELGHGVHIFISTWDSIVDDVSKLLKKDDNIESLRQGAKKAYATLFSTKLNAETVRRML